MYNLIKKEYREVILNAFYFHIYLVCANADWFVFVVWVLGWFFSKLVLELQYDSCDDQWLWQDWFLIPWRSTLQFFCISACWKYTIIAISFLDWLCYTQMLLLVYAINKQMKTWQNKHLKEKYCVTFVQLNFSFFWSCFSSP